MEKLFRRRHHAVRSDQNVPHTPGGKQPIDDNIVGQSKGCIAVVAGELDDFRAGKINAYPAVAIFKIVEMFASTDNQILIFSPGIIGDGHCSMVTSRAYLWTYVWRWNHRVCL